VRDGRTVGCIEQSVRRSIRLPFVAVLVAVIVNARGSPGVRPRPLQRPLPRRITAEYYHALTLFIRLAEDELGCVLVDV
jgi:hypothetical protein